MSFRFTINRIEMFYRIYRRRWQCLYRKTVGLVGRSRVNDMELTWHTPQTQTHARTRLTECLCANE